MSDDATIKVERFSRADLLAVLERAKAAEVNWQDEPQPGDLVYFADFGDWYCEHHGHLASERTCDYTKIDPFTGRIRQSGRMPIRVRTTVIAVIPTPDLGDIT